MTRHEGMISQVSVKFAAPAKVTGGILHGSNKK
jgi:hypothetical protein